MKKVQRSMILAAAAMACLPIAVTRCNVHGSSDDLATFDHPVEAGEEAAVSSDDASTENDEASTETTSDATTDAADKDGSAKDGGDAGDASEEPPGCPTPTNGAACTPHAVACGTATCTTTTNVCCATSFAATTGAPTGMCTATATGCGLNTQVACEEAADCTSGVCCETPVGGAPGSQTCATSCTPITSYQICRSNAECAGDAGCVPQSCPYGLGNTYKVEACGLQTGCTATN